MSINTTTLPNNLKDNFSMNIFMSMKERKIFRQFVSTQWSATSGDMHASDTVRFLVFGGGRPSTARLDEITDPSATSITNGFVDVQAHEYGGIKTLSHRSKVTDWTQILSPTVASIVTDEASLSDELACREAFDIQVSAPYVTFMGGGNTKSAITASDKFTSAAFIATGAKMRADAVAPFSKTEGHQMSLENNDEYVVIMHPLVHADLKAEVGEGGFTAVGTYTEAGRADRYNGEFGKLDNNRIIVNRLATVDYNAGAGDATDVDGAAAIGATTITLTDASDVVKGKHISIVSTVSGVAEKHSYVVNDVTGNVVTIGKCVAHNNNPLLEQNAGLIFAAADGDVVNVGVNVYTTYVVGYQAIAEAIVSDIETDVYNEPTGLKRKWNYIYKFFKGYAPLRDESLHKIYSSALNG